MDTPARLKDAFLTALIVAVLALPLAGARTTDGLAGLAVEWHVVEVGAAALLVFFGRLMLGLIEDGKAVPVAAVGLICGIAAIWLPMPSQFLKTVAVAGPLVIAVRAAWIWLTLTLPRHSQASGGAPSLSRNAGEGAAALTAAGEGKFRSVISFAKNYQKFALLSWLLVVAALIFPVTPLASRYGLDVAIMVMTYVMLAWGLNITVGYAGLLDLGYAGFYALGAYSYALLARDFGIGFWTALPVAGMIAAATALVLGFPVLRLRGDYFAVVTLGFGEIVRLVLTNWTNLTNGPNGISDIPRPSLFGIEFARQASAGHRTFSEMFGVDFDPTQRVIFLYYIILALALIVGLVGTRLRVLPLGRAWEAFRDNEIACAALGINRWWIKLAAYSMGATVAGLAGAFFATRQGFVSPESFTFTESATMLAIVILGGIGHPLGTVFAALFVIGMPELFRELEQYRMLAFGAGMVLIMIWRPGGLIDKREPTVRLGSTPLAGEEAKT